MSLSQIEIHEKVLYPVTKVLAIRILFSVGSFHLKEDGFKPHD